MQNPTKDQVIRRAYELWEQAGKPAGRDEEFYRQAEQDCGTRTNPRHYAPPITCDG